MAGFAAKVRQWAERTKAANTNITREATMELARRMLVTRFEGGYLRYDTGFLQASFIVQINAPVNEINYKPSGISRFHINRGAVKAVVNTMQTGDVAYMAFTANYAVYREYEDGMVRLVAQQWPQIVRSVSMKYRKMGY